MASKVIEVPYQVETHGFDITTDYPNTAYSALNDDNPNTSIYVRSSGANEVLGNVTLSPSWPASGAKILEVEVVASYLIEGDGIVRVGLMQIGGQKKYESIDFSNTSGVLSYKKGTNPFTGEAWTYESLENLVGVIEFSTSDFGENYIVNTTHITKADINVVTDEESVVNGRTIEIIEDFEDTNYLFGMNPSLTNWYRVNTPVKSGLYSLRSAVIGHGGLTSLPFTISVPAGVNSAVLSMDYQTSSETGYDYFRIIVDGKEEWKDSGVETVFENFSKSLAAGRNYSIELRYTKDSSADRGNDTVYIDNIKLSYIEPIYAPTVANITTTNIGSTSGTIGGSVTSTGGENPSRKIYWGTSDGGTNKASWGNVKDLGIGGTGDFTSPLSGLSNGTKYYYRAYASNSVGESWSASTSSFDTAKGTQSAPPLPILFEQTATTLGLTSMSGAIISVGGVEKPSGSVWTGLTKGTSYPVFAFLPETATKYRSPNTMKGNMSTAKEPVISSLASSLITSSSATISINLVDRGQKNTTIYFYWGTVDAGTGGWQNTFNAGVKSSTGVYSNAVTGLQPGTTYYYRAYAYNEVGECWVSTLSFVTGKGEQLAPTVPTASSVTGTSMVWTSSAGSQIVCNGQTKASGSTWTGLAAGTTYTAYAYMPGNTQYNQSPNSSNGSATTVNNPVISTEASPGGADTSADVVVNLSSTGGENPSVTIYWGTSDAGTGTWQNSKALGTKSAGYYTERLTGLSPNTTYYYRGYASNSAGVSWAGSSRSFTTSRSIQGVPPVPTASSITSSSIVWTSTTGAVIVANGVPKLSGSTWDGLKPATTYTASAYMPLTAAADASAFSASRSATTTGTKPALVAGRLKEGNLLISGDLNERKPGVHNGLILHYPMDGTPLPRRYSMKGVRVLYMTASDSVTGYPWTQWFRAQGAELTHVAQGSFLSSYSPASVRGRFDLILLDSNLWAIHLNPSALLPYLREGISVVATGNDTRTNHFVSSYMDSTTRRSHDIAIEQDKFPMPLSKYYYTDEGSADLFGGINSLQNGAVPLTRRMDEGCIVSYMYEESGKAIFYFDQGGIGVTESVEQMLYYAASRSSGAVLAGDNIAYSQDGVELGTIATNREMAFSDTMGGLNKRPFNSTSHSTYEHVTAMPNTPIPPKEGMTVWKIKNSAPSDYSRFGVSSRLATDIGGYDKVYTASVYIYIPSGVKLGNATNLDALQNSTGSDWHGWIGYDSTYNAYAAGSIRLRSNSADVNKRDCWQRLWITFKPLSGKINTTGGTNPAENNRFVNITFRPNLVGQDDTNFFFVSGLQIEVGESVTGYTETNRNAVSRLHVHAGAGPNFSFFYRFKPNMRWSETEQSGWFNKPIWLMKDKVTGKDIFMNDYFQNVDDYTRPWIGFDNFVTSAVGSWHWHDQPVRWLGGEDYWFCLTKSGTSWTKYYIDRDGYRKQTTTHTDPGLTAFDLASIDFRGDYSHSVRDVSIYDRALSEDEVKALAGSSFKLTKTGSTGSHIREIGAKTYSDGLFFPLSINGASYGGRVAPSRDTDIQYNKGAAWIGSGHTNLFTHSTNGAFTVQSGKNLEVVVNNKDEVIYRHDFSGEQWSYKGRDIAVTAGKTYFFSGDVYVSQGFNGAYNTILNIEQTGSRGFSYDMNKKGTWQKFTHSFTPSADGNCRILMYPGPNSLTGTQGYALYKNIQLTESNHERGFVNGTAGYGRLTYINKFVSPNDWNEFSIILTAKYASPGTWRISGTWGKFYFGVSTGNQVIFSWMDKQGTATAVQRSTVGGSVPSDKWVTIGCTVKNGVGIHLYLNGKRVGGHTAAFSLDDIASNFSLNSIDPNSTSYPLNAWVKNMHVIPRALTDAEMQEVASTQMKAMKDGTLKVSGNFSERIDI